VVGLLLVGRLLGKLAATEGGLGVLRGSAGCKSLECGRARSTHVRLVPLPEGGGVDVDNARLDEGLGSQKLVVGSVVALKESAWSRDDDDSSTANPLPPWFSHAHVLFRQCDPRQCKGLPFC
jgi:hypothetical protein